VGENDESTLLIFPESWRPRNPRVNQGENRLSGGRRSCHFLCCPLMKARVAIDNGIRRSAFSQVMYKFSEAISIDTLGLTNTVVTVGEPRFVNTFTRNRVISPPLSCLCRQTSISHGLELLLRQSEVRFTMSDPIGIGTIVNGIPSASQIRDVASHRASSDCE